MNDDDARPELADVAARQAGLLDAARPSAVAKRHAAGRRTARENLADLLDHGSFVEYGGLAVAAQRGRRSLSDLASATPADGVVLGIGRVAGVRAAVMSYDYTVLAGTQGLTGHAKTDRLFDVAGREGLPVVLFAEGGGGRPGDTDSMTVAALELTTFAAFARLRGPRIGSRRGTASPATPRCSACATSRSAWPAGASAWAGPRWSRARGWAPCRPARSGRCRCTSRPGWSTSRRPTTRRPWRWPRRSSAT